MNRIEGKSIGIDGVVFADRRRSLRRRTLKKVHLHFNNNSSSLLGTMRDCSEHGARIRFGDICAVPGRFTLMVGDVENTVPARICWRSLTEIGIVFEDACANPGADVKGGQNGARPAASG